MRGAAREIHTGTDPESVIIDLQTQTLYTANVVSNDVSVINPTQCDAETTTGCRHPVRTMPKLAIAQGNVTLDPWVQHLYVVNGNGSRLDDRHQEYPTPTTRQGCSWTLPTMSVGT